MPLPSKLARFNRRVTNPLALRVAGRAPGFGIVTHRGRRSDRDYRTPVNVVHRPDGFVFALTYGRGDWVKNVLHSGTATLQTCGRTYVMVNPRIVQDSDHADFPAPARLVLRLSHVSESLLADEAAPPSGTL